MLSAVTPSLLQPVFQFFRRDTVQAAADVTRLFCLEIFQHLFDHICVIGLLPQIDDPLRAGITSHDRALISSVGYLTSSSPLATLRSTPFTYPFSPENPFFTASFTDSLHTARSGMLSMYFS